MDCTCAIHVCNLQTKAVQRQQLSSSKAPSSHWRIIEGLKYQIWFFSFCKNCLLCQLNGNLVTRQETLFFPFFCRQGRCCGCCCRCMWISSATNGNESNPVNRQLRPFRFGTIEFTQLRANTQDIVITLLAKIKINRISRQQNSCVLTGFEIERPNLLLEFQIIFRRVYCAWCIDAG